MDRLNNADRETVKQVIFVDLNIDENNALNQSVAILSKRAEVAYGRFIEWLDNSSERSLHTTNWTKKDNAKAVLSRIAA